MKGPKLMPTVVLEIDPDTKLQRRIPTPKKVSSLYHWFRDAYRVHSEAKKYTLHSLLECTTEIIRWQLQDPFTKNFLTLTVYRKDPSL